MAKAFLEGNLEGGPEEGGQKSPQTHLCQAEKWEALFLKPPHTFLPPAIMRFRQGSRRKKRVPPPCTLSVGMIAYETGG